VSLSGKRVLLTGATGLIGNRLVEVLGRTPNVEIRALVHQFMNASRIARFPVAMFGGSLMDRDAVAAAMDGSDVVFHLAFGARGSDEERWQATVEGTRIVCEEALRQSVKRLVYTSTFSVYGQTADGDLTESADRKKSGDVYADSKLEAERLVLDYSRKRALPAIVLQPTIVYGPFSFWSRFPIQQLTQGIVVLPGGGHGLCNAVYVDDVVNALMLAATVGGQEGEDFLISGEEPCIWGDYYNGYAQMLPEGELDSGEADEKIAKMAKRSLKGRHGFMKLAGRAIRSQRVRRELQALPLVGAAYRGLKHAVPNATWNRWRDYLSAPSNGGDGTRRRLYPMPQHLGLLQSKTSVRIDKAVERLGYHPRTNLTMGLQKTEQWARWYGLVT
jgi:nucleoside-diphosphate-sugar epimerase